MTDKKPPSPLARLLASLPPYGGLRNDRGLPPFQQPGESLPFSQYLTRPAPPPPPSSPYSPPSPPSPHPPYSPPPPSPQPQTGGQGYAGPDPMAMGIEPQGIDPMLDPRYLPEQWRGAFNPRWQT